MDALALLAVVTLTWVNPTANTDGSAVGTIQSTRIERGTCGGTASNPTFGTKQGEWTQTGSAATSQSPDLPAGTHCFRAYTTTANGESGPSNVARKVILALPNPPSNLTVQEDATAWTIVQSRDRVALVAVGTVAPGTQCDASQPVLDKFVVPRTAVTFAGSVRPEVVLGTCG